MSEPYRGSAYLPTWITNCLRLNDNKSKNIWIHAQNVVRCSVIYRELKLKYLPPSFD